MLLNDIGKSPDSTLRKINQHLESNYGFRIAEDANDRDLVAIMEQIEEEIVDLKIKGNDSRNSSEISKRLLVLEGMKTLREFAILQFQSPDLEKVVNGMCDYICDHFRLGGTHHADFEDSVNDAMKHYRSSKYRFPDDMIEQRVRQGAMNKIHSMSLPASETGGEPVPDMNTMFEEGLDAELDEADFPPIEDPWGHTPKGKAHDTALGGHTPVQVTPGTSADKAIRAINPPQVGLKPPPMPPPALIRNPVTGQMQSDPWQAQKQARLKGIIKENILTRESYIALLEGLRGIPGIQQLSIDELGDKAETILRDQGIAFGFTDDILEDLFNNIHGIRENKRTFGKKGKIMKERANLVKNLRRILESEVQEAEVMMDAKKFSTEMQEMIEKIGRIQNESLPPVTTKMREIYGVKNATVFQTQIYGVMQKVMDSLYEAKTQIDDAVTNLALQGEIDAVNDMDANVANMVQPGIQNPGIVRPGEVNPGEEGEFNPEEVPDPDAAGDLDNIETDNFGGAEEKEPLGRAMKEAALQRKVMEMQRLVQRARTLRESQKNIDEEVRGMRHVGGGQAEYPTGDDRNKLAGELKANRAWQRNRRDDEHEDDRNEPRRGYETDDDFKQRTTGPKPRVGGATSGYHPMQANNAIAGTRRPSK